MINQLIGNYRITALLAEGGMGQVYRGRHQDLPREVVVKTIRLASFHTKDQEHLKARFIREAYIQSQLDHQNIVRVYEFIRGEENFYLVMEFIDGMSLRDLIQRRGAIAPEHVLPLLRQALEGLGYAHKFSYLDESGNRHFGVIHRDIKPANLLLDGMGQLKITDFGIVKLTGESGMTMTGFNPGTVEYMSPEQIRGMEVDARSDLYSLGVTFYEALSGRLPFPPSDTGSTYEVMRGHTELSPPPLQAVRPELSVGLANLLMRSLEKDPSRRYQSAGEWLDAINAYESAVASPAGTEVIALSVESQTIAGTEMLTETLGQQTSSTSARETSASYATNVISNSTTSNDPVAPSYTPPQSTPQKDYQTQKTVSRKRTPVMAMIAGVVLFAMIAAIIAFVMLRPDPQSASETSAAGTVNPTTSASPSTTSAVEDARLRSARDAEMNERYVDAIRSYEEYLAANPTAGDVASVSKQLATIKTLNGHLQMAKVWMDQGDFAEAKKDYAAALKAKPSSAAAKSGLAAAESKLSK